MNFFPEPHFSRALLTWIIPSSLTAHPPSGAVGSVRTWGDYGRQSLNSNHPCTHRAGAPSPFVTMATFPAAVQLTWDTRFMSTGSRMPISLQKPADS